MLVLVCGCGTIMHGPYQEIKVTSNPPGATITNTEYTCWIKTPGVMKLKRANSTVLTARLYGYKEAKQKVRANISPWLAGNAAGYWSPTTFFSNHVPAYYVLLMGDMATGSVGQLSPTEVHFELEPWDRKVKPNDGTRK